MKQNRKWFFSSATDETDLTEINFKTELMVDGEPIQDIVDFYDGRLIPQPSVGEEYNSRTSQNSVIVSKVEGDKVSYKQEEFFITGLPIMSFLQQFKLKI